MYLAPFDEGDVCTGKNLNRVFYILIRIAFSLSDHKIVFICSHCAPTLSS